ncbi:MULTISPECIES: nuclear transport factor 2 family protein [Amycolatopsis]|uniref:Nuclear transport factor 2 family protein n=1 Tax=Amycolatopsis dendrobii TaxID=2760662 RepID=A0A7W3VZK0_9PSEU|nr:MULTISPECIES: nuclear transport factor 2 family protein [Amycolatopsis]MBB1156099.1 nuclear transport factor 2 family protein [Amycolatopsis dendrobii]UKD58626.1 nuclear transport factor 2 family protein [Amycolatopsis sp. FU40]
MSAVSRNAETVATFLRLLEEGNIDDWMELWADEGAQYYPFGTEMFPRHLVGKAAIYDRWRGMPSMFDSLSFPIRETWESGDTVLARFDSACVLAGGKRYRNTYLGIFKFDDAGLLREYWEYFDPIVAGVEFGLAAVAYAPRRT